MLIINQTTYGHDIQLEKSKLESLIILIPHQTYKPLIHNIIYKANKPWNKFYFDKTWQQIWANELVTKWALRPKHAHTHLGTKFIKFLQSNHIIEYTHINPKIYTCISYSNNHHVIIYLTHKIKENKRWWHTNFEPKTECPIDLIHHFYSTLIHEINKKILKP